MSEGGVRDVSWREGWSGLPELFFGVPEGSKKSE